MSPRIALFASATAAASFWSCAPRVGAGCGADPHVRCGVTEANAIVAVACIGGKWSDNGRCIEGEECREDDALNVATCVPRDDHATVGPNCPSTATVRARIRFGREGTPCSRIGACACGGDEKSTLQCQTDRTWRATACSQACRMSFGTEYGDDCAVARCG